MHLSERSVLPSPPSPPFEFVLVSQFIIENDFGFLTFVLNVFCILNSILNFVSAISLDF